MSLEFNNPLYIGDKDASMKADVAQLKQDVGDLSQLDTADKSSLVNALNEAIDSTLNGASRDLDNLSDVGGQKLRSLNAYANEGELLTDAEGLADVKNYAHSTFDLSKFTVVGSPNITSDGIASGFSTSNYLSLDTSIFNQILNASSNWTIEGSFISNEITATNRFVTSASSNNAATSTLGLYMNGTAKKIRLSLGNSSTWNIANAVDGLTTIQPNIKYYYKLEFTGTEYNVYLKEGENDTYHREINIVSSTNISTQYTGDKILIGKDSVNLTFNLQQFSITVDGVPVFSGNKTGIDTIKPDDYEAPSGGTLPTISDDGIASGFSSSNHINTGYTLTYSNQNKILIKSRILTPKEGETLNYDTYWAYGGIDYGITLCVQTSNQRLSILNYAGTITLGYLNNFARNTWYDVELELDVVNSTQKTTITNLSTGTSTTRNTSETLTFDSNKFYIGLRTSGQKPLSHGSIDLNAFKIYVDGNLVYQPCLKIPYTESKTGSKIVNSIYRDRVNDMANQFGYANYYTLQDEPKGNYQVVGSPTISSDFVASGFSSSNYITFSSSISGTSVVSIYEEFTHHTTSGGQTLLELYNSNTSIGARVYAYDNKLNIAGGNQGSTTLVDGQKYKIRVDYSAGVFNIYLYNGNTWVLDATKSQTLTTEITSFTIGYSRSTSGSVMQGSIDLNAFKIYVDNKLVYEAVTEPNFTLPQVELYGLIGQRTLRDSYRNGINYWELYSNRDLEQGGSCTSGVEVTFARPFADTNYVLSVPYSAKSSTAFTPTQTGDWIAKGKGVL